MYKITLYDLNCCAISDGVTYFFVDDLEEFEKPWVENKLVCEEQKKRYMESKSGQITADYYECSPELNIVQCDEQALIIIEKNYLLKDRTYNLVNTYECGSVIYARKADISLRYIKFKEKYYLIGKYKLYGMCKRDYLHKEESERGWRYCKTWGNPIHKMSISTDSWIDEDGLRRIDWPKEKFSDDFIETYCWVTVEVYSDKEKIDISKLDNLKDEIVVKLMMDIPGEAG